MPKKLFKSKSFIVFADLSLVFNKFHFAIQRCVSEFISFITSEASDRCLQEKRKTINGEDILLGMLTLGFDSYVEPLRTFLTKVRDASKYDRTITMGGELTDDLRVKVAQAQANQTTTVQLQPPTTTTYSSPQTISSSNNLTNANTNGLEPYGHSVNFKYLLSH